jgi:hypothetical protein
MKHEEKKRKPHKEEKARVTETDMAFLFLNLREDQLFKRALEELMTGMTL